MGEHNQIIKIHNMSLFSSPWDPTKMAAYIVCETSDHRIIMILFKTLSSMMRINVNHSIANSWFVHCGSEVELILEGHSVDEVFSIYDLSTGEELNGKN